MGYGFPLFLVLIPYCVPFEDLLMDGVVVIDKVRIIVAVDIAPVFELRELFPQVRHCGAFRGGYLLQALALPALEDQHEEPFVGHLRQTV